MQPIFFNMHCRPESHNVYTIKYMELNFGSIFNNNSMLITILSSLSTPYLTFCELDLSQALTKSKLRILSECSSLLKVLQKQQHLHQEAASEHMRFSSVCCVCIINHVISLKKGLDPKYVTCCISRDDLYL